MAIFNSYVKIPDGTNITLSVWDLIPGTKRAQFPYWSSVSEGAFLIRYPQVIKHANEKSPINGGFNGNGGFFRILHFHVWLRLPKGNRYIVLCWKFETQTYSVEVSKSDCWQEEEDDEDWDDDESQLCFWLIHVDPLWGHAVPTPTNRKCCGFLRLSFVGGFMFVSPISYWGWVGKSTVTK